MSTLTGGSQSFEDVTNSAGVFQVPVHQDLMGGGISWFDYDNDGLTDVYFTGCRIRDVLFKNNGDESFSDVTIEAGLLLTDAFNTMGVVHGDINNDGYEDIFLTVWDEAATNELARNILYVNNGNGTFTDISLSAGIIDASFSTSAVLLDVNLDGNLDIYVLNYLEETEFIQDEKGVIVGFNHSCYDNYLYINNGDLTFTESAEEFGVLSGGCGLAVSSADVDKDGDPDLLIANDFGEFITPNQLYINNFPENNFTEQGQESGWGIGLYGMGVASGDIDNDLDLDYYITNLGSNALLLTDSDSFSYQDIAYEADVLNTQSENFFYTSWGDLFRFLDLYMANGHIPASSFIQNEQADPNRMYMNNGDLTFLDVSEITELDYNGICRGAAYSDYNKDGLLDISVSGIENPFFSEYQGVKIYKNGSDAGNWITFTLEGTTSNKNAFGSGITLYAEGQSFYRELSGGSSHLSQNESILHFGLGEIVSLDSAVVNWIGGQFQTVTDLNLNEFNHILQDFADNIYDLYPRDYELIPNPASNSSGVWVNIPEGVNTLVQLKDLSGKLIKEEELINSGKLSFELTSGIYIVTLNSDGYLWNQKLVISN